MGPPVRMYVGVNMSNIGFALCRLCVVVIVRNRTTFFCFQFGLLGVQPCWFVFFTSEMQKGFGSRRNMAKTAKRLVGFQWNLITWERKRVVLWTYTAGNWRDVNIHCRKGDAYRLPWNLKPVLNWANVCSPNILRTLRGTMIRFLIELLVRRTWFGQSKLYFVLSWLVMRCKLRPEPAADAQQTTWSKM